MLAVRAAPHSAYGKREPRDSPSARHRQRAIPERAFLIPSQVLSTLATRNRAFQRMLTWGVEIEYGTAECAIRGATFV